MSLGVLTAIILGLGAGVPILCAIWNVLRVGGLEGYLMALLLCGFLAALYVIGTAIVGTLR